jgi:hypothetical protein
MMRRFAATRPARSRAATLTALSLPPGTATPTGIAKSGGVGRMRLGFTSLDTLQPASVIVAKQTVASDLARKFRIASLRFR